MYVRTMERCENRNVCTSERSCNGTEGKLFYCLLLYEDNVLLYPTRDLKRVAVILIYQSNSETCGFKNHISN